MKNYRNAFKIIILVIMFLEIACITNEVKARSYSIENMDIQATVLQNGTVEVSHTLTYKFNGEYNGIFIKIPCQLDDEEYDRYRSQTSVLKDSLYNNEGVEIKQVSEIINNSSVNYRKVFSSYNGNSNVYTTTLESGIYNLKVYKPSNNITRTFNIKYELKNVCVKHNDIGELYYNFIGGGWEKTIKKLNIDIHLPNNNNIDNLYIFAHGPYNGEAKIVSQNELNFKVSNIYPGQYVATRVLFDLSNIPNSTKISDIDAMKLVLAEENRITENKEAKNKFTQTVLLFVGALAIYWLILVLVYEKDKKFKKIEIDEDELFEKYNPLLAGCIQGSRTILARDIIAVILNLINKKIINLEIKGNLQGKDSYTYLITKNPEAEGKMDNIEKYVYDWIFTENNGVINLVDRLKELPKEEAANKKFKELNDIAQTQLKQMGANKEKVPKILRIFNTIVFILSIIVVVMHIQYNGFNIYGAYRTGKSGVMTLPVAMLILIPTALPTLIAILYDIINLITTIRHKISKATQRFTGKRLVTTTITITLMCTIIILATQLFNIDRYIIADELLICISLVILLTDNLMLKNDDVMIEDFSRLNALKDKIKDDTLMEERDIEQITLWERYLSYAISFGVANKIIKRIKGLNLDDDLNKLITDEGFYKYISSDYNTFYMYASLDRIFLKNYKKSINDITSSYGGGGGFSGGGGFHGGGRKRWRPEEHSSYII